MHSAQHTVPVCRSTGLASSLVICQGAAGRVGRCRRSCHAFAGPTGLQTFAPYMQTSSVPSPVFEALLRWTSDAVHAPCAEVQQLPGCGRGLVASMDVPPDGVILSVPFSRVFASMEQQAFVQQQEQQQQQQQEQQGQEEQAGMPWVAEMAARLLLDRQRCKTGSPDAQWCTWLACLPTHVATPLEFSDAELQACGDPALIADVVELRASLQAAHQELQPELSAGNCGSWDDFMWAVQVLHSRCFFEPGAQQHLTVPGIDMANHSVTPNATVRILHSPDAVQGRQAAEEVAAPVAAGGAHAAGQSLFQLVAGEDGISAGEEVTISYGRWPSDVFFLLFGFLPEVAHESQVLYLDLHDALQHHRRVLLSSVGSATSVEQPQQAEHAAAQHQCEIDLSSAHGSNAAGSRMPMLQDDAVWGQVADRLSLAASDADEGGLQGGWQRLVVTAEGYDARLVPSLSLLQGALAAEGLPAPPVQVVLQHRLLELSAALAQGSSSGNDSTNFAQARMYAEPISLGTTAGEALVRCGCSHIFKGLIMASSTTELRLIARYFGAALTRASSVATKPGPSSALLSGADKLELGLHSAMMPLIKQMQVASMFESATAAHTGPAAIMTKAVQSASRASAQL